VAINLKNKKTDQ